MNLFDLDQALLPDYERGRGAVACLVPNAAVAEGPAAQLRAEPLCRFCSRRGRITAAAVCDHVTQHKGDQQAFWTGPFQSLCASCHSATKQQQERRGFSTEVGPDGWPVDPREPWHAG